MSDESHGFIVLAKQILESTLLPNTIMPWQQSITPYFVYQILPDLGPPEGLLPAMHSNTAIIKKLNSIFTTPLSHQTFKES